MANRWGNNGNRERLYFCGLQNHWRWLLQPWNWKTLAPWKKWVGRKVMTNLDSILKSRAITLTMKVQLVKAMVFPVVLYGCENWTINKAEHWRPDTFNCGVGEDSWESWRSNQSILKEISPVGRTDVEAEAPILWPSDAKTWFMKKDPDPGKDWRWEEKGTTEDETVGWHHWLNRHEFE